MVSVIARPPEFILSGMPAWFVVQSSTPGDLIVATITCNSKVLGVEYSFASMDSRGSFNLQEYFDNAITPSLSSFSETSQIVHLNSDDHSRLSKTFVISFSDSDNIEQSESITAVKGRITADVAAMIHYGITSNNFQEYLTGTKSFLSLKPDVIHVYYPNQPERLCFAISEASLTGTITVKRTVIRQNGTVSQSNAATIYPTLGNVYEIRTSYRSFVSYAVSENPENPVVRYQVQLFSGSVPISKVITYVIDFREGLNKSFVFVNSLGGIDTFCPTGKTFIRHSGENKVSELSNSPHVRQNTFRITESSLSLDMSCNTGFIDKATFLWLSQLFFNRNGYLVHHHNDQSTTPMIVPVVFTKNSLEIQTSTNELLSARFNYIYNYKQNPEFQVPK